MKPDTAKRVSRHRLARHPVARAQSGTLQPARRRARGQHPQGRIGDVRSRGPGFLEIAADDERHRADVGAERRRADDSAEGSARETAARSAEQLSRVRADRRDRAVCRDLRQHQAAAQGRDHRDGEGRGRQTVHSRRARSATARSWPVPPAATDSRRAFRSRTFAPGLYVLRVEAITQHRRSPDDRERNRVPRVAARRERSNACCSDSC